MGDINGTAPPPPNIWFPPPPPVARFSSATLPAKPSDGGVAPLAKEESINFDEAGLLRSVEHLSTTIDATKLGNAGCVPAECRILGVARSSRRCNHSTWLAQSIRKSIDKNQSIIFRQRQIAAILHPQLVPEKLKVRPSQSLCRLPSMLALRQVSARRLRRPRAQVASCHARLVSSS